MRSEQEMMDLLLGLARGDERIRAVVMNGSRVNPNAPKDIFQDYDIVYVVTSVEGFVRDRAWMGRFGDLLIMQTPTTMCDPGTGAPPSENTDGRFTFLMLFRDGNRIDLTLQPMDRIEDMEPDSLSLLLLDKDGLIRPFPPASDSDYLPKPPSAQQYADCCNEFWWVCPYVAKGLWRRELPYAQGMLEGPVRGMLQLMLTWHVGVHSGFSVNVGKCGKYLERYLPPELWARFVQTYSDGAYDNVWRSLLVACDLFREVALTVGERLRYLYPLGDDERVLEYLQHVRALPRDASGIY